jgi:hypothetical protein
MDTPPPVEDTHHDLTLDLLQGGIVWANGDLLLGLRPVDAERAIDRVDPFRCGLDHLSLSMPGRADLEAAVRVFQERGVEHSTITELPPFDIAVLPFKDPDGVATRAGEAAESAACQLSISSNGPASAALNRPASPPLPPTIVLNVSITGTASPRRR